MKRHTLKELGLEKYNNDSNNTTALAEHLDTLGIESFCHVGDDEISKYVAYELFVRVANANVIAIDFRHHAPEKGTSDGYLNSEYRDDPLHVEFKTNSFKTSSAHMEMECNFSCVDDPDYFCGFFLVRSADPRVDRQTLEYYRTYELGNDAMYELWESSLGQCNLLDEEHRSKFIKVVVVPFSEIKKVAYTDKEGRRLVTFHLQEDGSFILTRSSGTQVQTFGFGDPKILDYFKTQEGEPYFDRSRISQDAGGWDLETYGELKARTKRVVDNIRKLPKLVRLTNDWRGKYFVWKWIVNNGGRKGDIYVFWNTNKVSDAVYGEDGSLDFIEAKYANARAVQETRMRLRYYVCLKFNQIQGKKKPNLAAHFCVAILDARNVDPVIQEELLSTAKDLGYPTSQAFTRQVLVIPKERFDHVHKFAVYPKEIHMGMNDPSRNTLTTFIHPRFRFDDPCAFSLCEKNGEKEGSLYNVCLMDNGEVPLKKPLRPPPPPPAPAKRPKITAKYNEICQPVNGHIITRDGERRNLVCVVCGKKKSQFYCDTCSHQVWLCSRECIEKHGEYPKFDAFEDEDQSSSPPSPAAATTSPTGMVLQDSPIEFAVGETADV